MACCLVNERRANRRGPHKRGNSTSATTEEWGKKFKKQNKKNKELFKKQGEEKRVWGPKQESYTRKS